MSKTVPITQRDFNKIKKALIKSYDGLIKYTLELQDTYVCTQHLDVIYEILKKYEGEK